jgi:hypothetical protein
MQACNKQKRMYKYVYNQKEIELVVKYGPALVATYWPELVPKLPTNIDDLKDLPEDYKATTTKCRFLASPIESRKQELARIMTRNKFI